MRGFVALLLACSHAATPPAEVRIVRETPRSCELPPVPEAPKPFVGFPTATTIYVSTTDLTDLMTHIVRLDAWAVEASRCLR